MWPAPETWFFTAFAGMSIHAACSFALSFCIEEDTDLFRQLFAYPAFEPLSEKGWYLRGRYFLPWVAAPEELREYWLWPRLLFWGARSGAMLLIGGFALFLCTVTYNIGRP